MTNEIRSSGETVTGRRNGLPRNQGEDYTMYSIIYYTKFSVRFRFFFFDKIKYLRFPILNGFPHIFK